MFRYLFIIFGLDICYHICPASSASGSFLFKKDVIAVDI